MNDKKIEDGGPAFPSGERYKTVDLGGNVNEIRKPPYYNGLSLRDWFAGQALAGMFANHAIIDNYSAHEQMAKESYIVADAMIAARGGAK